LNYNTIPPTLPMATVVYKTKPIKKVFNVKNTGIKSVQIDWLMFDQEVPGQKNVSALGAEDDIFDIDIVNNLAFDRSENPFKFEFAAISRAIEGLRVHHRASVRSVRSSQQPVVHHHL
jgi:hypothetical protein